MLRGKWLVTQGRRAKVVTVRLTLDEPTLRRLEQIKREEFGWLDTEAALVKLCAEEGIYAILNARGEAPAA